ncbi:hypothetical protein [Acinetobacter defluvii]|uniref:hypothetical protein n=1 Tax=Acinetobacter defluvii TaxID=1871111 RepID=UPI00149006F8|nr:hypothetical protein [Acinetobacter defluvii]
MLKHVLLLGLLGASLTGCIVAPYDDNGRHHSGYDRDRPHWNHDRDRPNWNKDRPNRPDWHKDRPNRPDWSKDRDRRDWRNNR